MGFREAIEQFLPVVEGHPLRLGMGCATLGNKSDAASLMQYQATLDAAYEQGLRYYDTSVLYGGSEFRVGEFLRRVPRENVFIATKSTVLPSLTPAEARRMVRERLHSSLERLGVEQIDLFQIHDVETLDQVLPDDGILSYLIKAREEGLIRYFGLATRYHDLLRTAVRHGEFDTILTYLDYTPLDQSAAPLITEAAHKNVGVINGSPLAFGLLTGHDPRTNPNISREFRRYIASASDLYDFAAARKVSMLSLALQFPLLHPGISITLTGPATSEELKASLSACREPLPETFWQELHAELGVRLPEQEARARAT
jgi:aryl-alcohol dehydrogenase-like predicted oxidoreductase